MLQEEEEQHTCADVKASGREERGGDGASAI